MEIILAPAALEDLEYWKRINNAAILKRIELLLADIAEQKQTQGELEVINILPIFVMTLKKK